MVLLVSRAVLAGEGSVISDMVTVWTWKSSGSDFLGDHFLTAGLHRRTVGAGPRHTPPSPPSRRPYPGDGSAEVTSHRPRTVHLTVWVSTAEVLARKSGSELYTAVMLCLPRVRVNTTNLATPLVRFTVPRIVVPS